MARIKLYIASLLSLCLFASCTDNVVFQDVKIIPEEGWSKESPIEFLCTMNDTSSIYEVVVDVHNKSSYIYQNLWLFVEARNPKGDVYSDTIECILADNKGKWVGDGAGSYFAGEYRLPVSFMDRVKFPQAGEYKFDIYQGMREDVLHGISEMGIRIRYAD